MDKNDDKFQQMGMSGLFIPAEILLHPDTNDLDGYVFGLVSNLEHTTRGCWASNKYLGIKLNRSFVSISKSVNRLIKLDFLKAEYTKTQNGQRRQLRVNRQYLEHHRQTLVEAIEEQDRQIAKMRSKTAKPTKTNQESVATNQKSHLKKPLSAPLKNSLSAHLKNSTREQKHKHEEHSTHYTGIGTFTV